MRRAIPAEEKLAATLRFLATGESFPSMQYQFRIHRTTIAAFIPVVCKTIYQVLKDEYLRMLETKEEWLYYARKTAERWQFPNCIGADDGKHISVLHPFGLGMCMCLCVCVCVCVCLYECVLCVLVFVCVNIHIYIYTHLVTHLWEVVSVGIPLKFTNPL